MDHPLLPLAVTLMALFKQYSVVHLKLLSEISEVAGDTRECMRGQGDQVKVRGGCWKEGEGQGEEGAGGEGGKAQGRKEGGEVGKWEVRGEGRGTEKEVEAEVT
jgi:hypothetical protein